MSSRAFGCRVPMRNKDRACRASRSRSCTWGRSRANLLVTVHAATRVTIDAKDARPREECLVTRIPPEIDAHLINLSINTVRPFLHELLRLLVVTLAQNDRDADLSARGHAPRLARTPSCAIVFS